MKNVGLVVFFLLFSFLLEAQKNYKPGYFIDNNDTKINCLIKDRDSRETPAKFYYKIENDEARHSVGVGSVKEVNIENVSAYIRCFVEIDKVGYDESSAEYINSAEFENDTLFLRQLVGGKAALYTYVEDDIELFFYSVDGSPVIQLRKKYYKVPDPVFVRVDKSYLVQLQNNLKCSALSFDDFSDLRYSKSDLIKLFRKYNLHYDPSISYSEHKKREGIVNLYVNAGLNYTTLKVDNTAKINGDINFPWKWSPAMGLNFEYVIPYYNYKWSFLLNSQFQRFSDTQASFWGPATAKLNLLDLSFGVRHYFYFDNKSKMYINAFGGVCLPVGSKVEFEDYLDLDMVSRLCASFGIGYSMSDKYSVELKYGSINGFITGIYWKSNYQYVGLHLAYNLFEN